MATNDTLDTNDTQICSSESIRSLDELLETRYRELFGEDYLYEDISQLHTEKINKLDAPGIPVDVQYERAMAEYRRELEAEVTQYQAGSTINFPPTMRCVKIPDPEEGLELNIAPEEVNEIIGTPLQDTSPQLSGRKRKREDWRIRRNMARKMNICKKKN